MKTETHHSARVGEIGYLRTRLAEARKTYKSLAEKLKGSEAELAFMNDQYAKLTTDFRAVTEARRVSHECEQKLDKELQAARAENKILEERRRTLEERRRTLEMDLKSEQKFTKREQVARDEWKAFALGLVVQLIAIDSVVKDAGGDEPAAVRQLVLGAKKIPHPQADPVHPNIWKWAILSPALMVGAAAYFLYKGLGGPAGAAK